VQRIVGIGEIVISNNIEDTIKTFALASCIGVVAYSPFRKVGGMIHIALPSPPLGSESTVKCCYYASVGIPYFISCMSRDYGCLKGELIISLYGGANSIRTYDAFNIGRKNIDASRNILSEMNLKFNDTETGKSVSRTIELDILTGQVVIAYQQIKI
jgi:chemotaxis protein CheD